jgi:uroporphyrinogen decarboxylase
MTGKERILKALCIEEADRVPLFIHGINEAPIMGIGKRFTDRLPEGKQLYQMTDAEKGKLVETLLQLIEEFEIDGYTCLPIGPGTEFDAAEEPVDDWGVGFARSAVGIPVPTRHPILSGGDLRRYRPPAPKREQLVLVDLMKQRFGEQKAIFWMMRGAFVRSWRLTGMTNLMMKMYEAPEFVHRIAAMVTEYSLQQLEMLAAAGLDVLIVEDDIADKNQPLVSPAHFTEFINPYNRRLVDRAHGLGMKVVRHSDGNLWPILDILLDTGYDGLNPLEPQAGMHLKTVKEYCGDRLCLLGNIDCQELLPNGTPAQVKAAVRRAIDDAAAGGGLIICSSNTLHPGVDPENCIAMFEAVREFGAYSQSFPGQTSGNRAGISTD